MKRRLTLIFLMTLTGLALVLCYVIARPFLRPVISATVIAIVFFPVHARIAKTIRSPSLASLVSTMLVLLIILIPAVLIGAAVTRELLDLYHLLGEESSGSGGWRPYLLHFIEQPLELVGRYVDVSGFNSREAVLNGLRQASGFLVGRGAEAVTNIGSFLVNSVISLFTLFFLFREGKSFRRRIAAVLPLNAGQVEKLFDGISNAIIGTMYGGIAVAVVQGSLTSIAFASLGLPSPILWGVVTAMFSLVPMVGSAAVWLPASIILIATGSWGKGLILLGCGAGVISTVDNLIRPYIISGRVQLHTLLVFFAVLGGIRAFGVIGLFIGPVALAVTTVLFGILREESRAWEASWREEQPAPGEAPGEAMDAGS